MRRLHGQGGTRHFIQHLGYALLLTLWLALTWAVAAPAAPAQTASEHERRAELDQIVLSTLSFYAGKFPDIDFVVIDSSGDVGRNMSLLARIIGNDPVPLDYEHPEQLRDELLYVTYLRIEILLQEEVGSATLFRPGSGALAKRDNVCIVTLNPWAVARNDRAATRHLLDLPPAAETPVPEGHHLDADTHLRFALDHEIYHCLDTRFNGGMPRSHREHWAGYMMLRDESGADAFALITQIARQGVITQDAKALREIRGLTLLAGDPDHYTYRTLGAVLKLDPEYLARMDVRQRFRLASDLRDRTVGSYADYMSYARAAAAAIHNLRVDVPRPPNRQRPADEDAVRKLIADTRRCYRRLTGRPLD